LTFINNIKKKDVHKAKRQSILLNFALSRIYNICLHKLTYSRADLREIDLTIGSLPTLSFIVVIIASATFGMID
jgi:hypothetical protein